MDSTKVEPSKSRRNVTIEELEDEDIQKMNAKEKSRSESLLEENIDDEQMFDQINRHVQPKARKKTTLAEVPEAYGNRYHRPTTPDVFERYVPALHSDTYKYKGPTAREEVLLAVMDANLNEMKEEEDELPDL